MAWLDGVMAKVTAGVGQDALALSPEEVATVLDLARIASHASGDRTNAPLLCYLLGVAGARGASLDHLAAEVRAATAEAPP